MKPPLIDEIQKAFVKHNPGRFELVVPNIMMDQHNSEMDLIGVRNSGFLDEVEIKVSRADFLADFKKTVKVKPEGKSTFANHVEMLKHQAIVKGLMEPNYFSYLITQAMYDEGSMGYLVQGYGLYVCRLDSLGVPRVIEVQEPTRMHPRKVNMLTKYNIARKLNVKYWR